ncbi:MAG TPA: phosphatidylglycerol lysyltransferase domain-containing protein [Bacteroidales bacterium]|nr:phosphatidylglycerol lysyltransferase domain-containing protein [Bacteroidales bacterium]
MIPQFPAFKNLDLYDKEEVEKYTSAFPPYAEYQFATMCCWEIHQPFQLSIINGNLLLKQTNCLTGEYFFSLIGKNNLTATVRQVLDFLTINHVPSALKCLPEEMVKTLDPSLFRITEDRDNFDYIYPVAGFLEARGSKYRVYRHKCATFKTKYPGIITRILDLTAQQYVSQILTLYDTWANTKAAGNKNFESTGEHNALKKLLSIVRNFDSVGAIGLFDRQTLIAFSIFDINNAKFLTGLFCKANTGCKGVYQYLMKEIVALSSSRGIEYLNWEADLGIESIRKSKIEMHPAFFLKKYIMEPI